jgi:hypothetical protein
MSVKNIPLPPKSTQAVVIPPPPSKVLSKAIPPPPPPIKVKEQHRIVPIPPSPTKLPIPLPPSPLEKVVLDIVLKDFIPEDEKTVFDMTTEELRNLDFKIHKEDILPF